MWFALVSVLLAAPSLHGFTVEDIHGQPFAFSALKGKAVLLVNTASQCGFTPQYAGLERLHRRYKDRGLVVLAVPSNDFGGQEPGGREVIHGFVKDKFEATFTLLDKAPVKGSAKSPLYQWLTTAGPEGSRGEVKWNFTKFLIGAEGQILARFESGVDPLAPEVVAAVEAALKGR